MTQNIHSQPIKIWDLPTRFFHWSLAFLVMVGWWTSTADGNMDWHLWGGYALLVLLLFRILWGFIGSSSARFASFVASPHTVFVYLARIKNKEEIHSFGHNPAGGWMVLLLLGTLLCIVISGLFANDDMMLEGPLAHYIGKHFSDLATALHEQSFYGLLLFVAVHVSAIVIYLLYKKENLLLPMLTGIKQVPQDVTIPPSHFRNNGFALLILCVVASLVALLVKFS